jgi:DNA-binding CsgD family transcriptional regulator
MIVESRLRGLAEAMDRAPDFVEVAKLVCVETVRIFELDHCVVSLYATSGRPVIAVDNASDLTDEHRLRWVGAGAWRSDPLYKAMVEHHVPVCDAELRTWLLPIIESAGLLGSIRCAQRGAVSPERDLFMLSAVVSVRLARLGVTAVHDTPGTATLTPRQHDVARLAATGLTNGEIGEALGISTNTVKNRLKQVFDRLDVLRRVELVGALEPVAAHADVPIGITRDGSLTITCASLD